MKRALMALFVATFVFSSCSVLDRKPTIYYNEEELTLEEIAQMAESFKNAESENATFSLIAYGDENVSTPFYWTEGGSVWHRSIECGHLRNTDKVFYGAEADAIKCGKQRACSSCGNNN